jgi:Flp pilus assembly pilin Flp
MELINAARGAWQRHFGERRGQSVVEYALITSLIILVVLLTVVLLGHTLKNVYCNVGGQIARPGS